MELTKELKSWLVENGYAVKSWTADHLWIEAANKAIGDGSLTVNLLTEFLPETQDTEPKPSQVFGGKAGGRVRVKSPSERYSSTKSVAKHSKSGLTVRDERGREVMTTSEIEYVKAGVLFKRAAQRSGLPVSLNEHERELLGEMFESEKWCGRIDGEYKTGIDGMQVKALLDDATSGGQEIVPEFFDEMIVQFPLLHSELLPRVDLRDIPRGSSVEGASVGNPTLTWGTAEGTAISTFDTSDLVAAIDTTIHPVTAAIEIGRDFMSDSPADIGRILVENIGQRLLFELDRVIVIGNGTTEPQGIFNASGITDIGNPAGGAGADPQVDDYETLLFSVGKQYRNPTMRCAYICNDTTYSRARGIAVGASDARRVFGMDHSSYQLLQHPVVIQNSIGNASAAFGALARYRLYRRQGQEIRFTTEGRELNLKNLALLVVRGRYGGKVIDANAFAFSDNFKA